TLANATLGGGGGLTNNGWLFGFGTVAGSGGFVNNALFTLAGGSVNLNNTGSNANFGNIDLAAGLQLRLNGGALNNRGGIDLNSGTVAGTVALNNNAGGTIMGRGAISAPFNNTGGVVLLDGGTLNVLQNFANGGTIQL